VASSAAAVNWKKSDSANDLLNIRNLFRKRPYIGLF